MLSRLVRIEQESDWKCSKWLKRTLKDTERQEDMEFTVYINHLTIVRKSKNGTLNSPISSLEIVTPKLLRSRCEKTIRKDQDCVKPAEETEVSTVTAIRKLEGSMSLTDDHSIKWIILIKYFDRAVVYQVLVVQNLTRSQESSMKSWAARANGELEYQDFWDSRQDCCGAFKNFQYGPNRSNLIKLKSKHYFSF